MKVGNFRKTTHGYAHYCPACNEMHHIPTPRWTVTPVGETLSFSPSINISATDPDEGVVYRCHYTITQGMISFCGDCTHTWAGRTTPVPELPMYAEAP